MTNHEKIQKLTLTAILAVLTIVLAFVPFKTSALEITFTIIPIAVGGIIAGPVVGLVLGSVFGVTSFLQCLGYSPFGATLLGINPLLTFLVCVPTRMFVGWGPAFLNQKLSKVINRNIASAITCFLVPVLNTLLFMAALMFCFYKTEFIQSMVTSSGATNPFAFVIIFVGIQGLIEMLCGIFISFPVVKAVDVVLTKNKR